MDVAAKLASALDRRDEQPNIELAIAVAESENQTAILDLIEIVQNGKRDARHDAIKVLYEIAERKPHLLSKQVDIFLELLKERDNRMIWGAMSALAALAGQAPEQLMAALNDILAAADRSGVIAKDKAMVLLASLNTDSRYHDILMPVIFTRLANAAVNQTPMYCELAAPSLLAEDIPRFRAIVEQRIAEIPQPAKKARLEKLLRKLER